MQDHGVDNGRDTRRGEGRGGPEVEVAKPQEVPDNPGTEAREDVGGVVSSPQAGSKVPDGRGEAPATVQVRGSAVLAGGHQERQEPLTVGSFNSRVLGVVFGTAVGDALGYPVEFMDMEGIHSRFGSQGVTGFSPHHERRNFPPLDILGDVPESVEPRIDYPYSDDTQMFLATLKGLMRARTWDDLNAAAEEVAVEYVVWSRSAENDRSPGNACMAGCRNLGAGIPWRKSGVEDAKGCGASMRSMAYGLWHWDCLDKAASWAAHQALMTHRSREAMASAAMVAVGVAGLIQGASPSVALATVHYYGVRYDQRTADSLLRAVSLGSDLSRVLDLFRGWRGSEAVAASYSCFARTPGDYKAAVLSAVNSPGDSDSLGCITGSLVGAFRGLGAIPSEWLVRIENKHQLMVLGDRVSDVLTARCF